MSQYRKRKDSTVWHWCKNCTNWPQGSGSYITRDTEPVLKSSLCVQCIAKASKNDCNNTTTTAVIKIDMGEVTITLEHDQDFDPSDYIDTVESYIRKNM